ncbi:MAG: hypothetical protein WCI51_06590 [Lentisphaerota bacterium]
MPEAISVICGFLFTTALIVIFFGGFLMLLGAKVAGVNNAVFWKAILATIACVAISLIISIFFSVIPVIGTIIGFMLSLFIQVFIIKTTFDTSVGKALLTWIFFVVAQIISIILAFIALSAGFAISLR